MMVEDAPESRRPVRDNSPHFPVFREFQGASYLSRYDILCQRLVQEQLHHRLPAGLSPHCRQHRGLCRLIRHDQPDDLRHGACRPYRGRSCSVAAMNNMAEVFFQKIKAEVKRLKEDCTHPGKSHFNTADRRSRYNSWIGVPSIILSAVAGTAFFKDYTSAAGAMSSVVAVLAALRARPKSSAG